MRVRGGCGESKDFCHQVAAANRNGIQHATRATATACCYRCRVHCCPCALQRPCTPCFSGSSGSSRRASTTSWRGAASSRCEVGSRWSRLATCPDLRISSCQPTRSAAAALGSSSRTHSRSIQQPLPRPTSTVVSKSVFRAIAAIQHGRRSRQTRFVVCQAATIKCAAVESALFSMPVCVRWNRIEQQSWSIVSYGCTCVAVFT